MQANMYKSYMMLHAVTMLLPVYDTIKYVCTCMYMLKTVMASLLANDRWCGLGIRNDLHKLTMLEWHASLRARESTIRRLKVQAKSAVNINAPHIRRDKDFQDLPHLDSQKPWKPFETLGKIEHKMLGVKYCAKAQGQIAVLTIARGVALFSCSPLTQPPPSWVPQQSCRDIRHWAWNWDAMVDPKLAGNLWF